MYMLIFLHLRYFNELFDNINEWEIRNYLGSRKAEMYFVLP